MIDPRQHLYKRWRGMHKRCNASVNDKSYKYYSDVTVCEEWDDFENFYCWAIDQCFINKHLDKDIIGNSRIYGPDTCVFVNPITNFFFQRREDEVMRGIYYDGSAYVARCSNPMTGFTEYLGRYSNEEDARSAFRLRKYYHACLLADLEDDIRVKRSLVSKFYVDDSRIPLHVILNCMKFVKITDQVHYTWLTNISPNLGKLTMNTEQSKQIVEGRLGQYRGADFSQDNVKFKFAKAVQDTLTELRYNGVIVTQDALQFGNTSAMFVGVTFEGGEDFPEYKFARIMRY